MLAGNPTGLVAFALLLVAYAFVVLFAERDRGFPLPLSRRAVAIVLCLLAAFALVTLAAPSTILVTPGWLTTFAFLGAASLVAALGTLLRAMSIPAWLRITNAAVCFFAFPLLAILVFS